MQLHRKERSVCGTGARFLKAPVRDGGGISTAFLHRPTLLCYTLLAYQTNRNELVGTARVLGFKASEGSRHLVVRPLEKIGNKVRPLKKADSRIDRIPALQGGEIKTLYEIAQSDALYFLRAAKPASSAGPDIQAGWP